MFITIKKDVTAAFSTYIATGDVTYDSDLHALAFGEANEPAAIISINLSDYGFVTGPDTVFIKDWSEHRGLTASLVTAGVVEIVSELELGPYNSRSYEVRVLAPMAAAETAAITQAKAA